MMLSPWWKQLDILMETCSYPWTNPDPKNEYENDSDYEFFNKKIVLSNIFIYDIWDQDMIHIDYLLERAEKYIPFLKENETIDFSLSEPEIGLKEFPALGINKYQTTLTYIKIEVFNYKEMGPESVRFLEEFYIESPTSEEYESIDFQPKNDIPHRAYLPPIKTINT